MAPWGARDIWWDKSPMLEDLCYNLTDYLCIPLRYATQF